MSPCLGWLKSFLATSTPSRKRYSWIALRSALGISLAHCQYFALSLNARAIATHILAAVTGGYLAGGEADEEVVVSVVARPSITFKCGGSRRSENLCAPTLIHEASAASPVLFLRNL